MSDSSSLLSGIRVIDCGTYIAGPAAAAVLSDFGAEVIKIERPPLGDPYRYLPLVPGMPVSPLQYCWILDGRNKKSVALDLNDPAAREALGKLVAQADIFVTNYQPQLAKKFRVEYSDLAPINPRLIYGSLTGYGFAGDETEKPGYDMTAYWARSGMMSTMCNADSEPVQSPPGFGDHPTAMSLVAGLMMGLYRRALTGQGMCVTTSLLANGAWANSCSLQAALVGAQFLPKWTRATAVNPIVNHYLTRDGKRFITCCLDPRKDWPNLCRALGRTEWIDDPRFASPESRRANAAPLIAMIDALVADKDMADWSEIFREHDVIWGAVPRTEEVIFDPQMQANGVFPEIEPGLRTVANPLAIAGVDKVRPRMAPRIGEHTVEVLESLGYKQAAIADMLSRGVAKDDAVAKEGA